MKTTNAILFAFATVASALAQSPASAQNGVPEVFLDRANSDIFPESWLTPKINAKAELLSQDDQPRCREIIGKVLVKYPAGLLNANLKKVYLLGRLEYSGVATGGTNSRSAVYVVGIGKYSTADIEKNFHAEFSSILLRNFPQHFDKGAWERINPPEFRYRGSGVQAIKDNQASSLLKTDFYDEGFLHEYSKASLEEDFNSYAARLFMGDAKLWNAIETFPKVKAKAELAIEFYGKLDAVFTRDWFLSLRSPETK